MPLHITHPLFFDSASDGPQQRGAQDETPGQFTQRNVLWGKRNIPLG